MLCILSSTKQITALNYRINPLSLRIALPLAVACITHPITQDYMMCTCFCQINQMSSKILTSDHSGDRTVCLHKIKIGSSVLRMGSGNLLLKTFGKRANSGIKLKKKIHSVLSSLLLQTKLDTRFKRSHCFIE